MEDNQINEAISNLEIISNAFEKASLDPKYYNSDFGCFLENFSHELYKMKNELSEYKYIIS